MSVILIDNARARRAAINLAESMSSNPSVRAAARARALAMVNQREARRKHPFKAEVIDFIARRVARRA